MFVMTGGIEDAPVTTNCTFQLTLPGLIEGFDEIVIPPLRMGGGNEPTDEACFIHQAGQRPLTHPPGARPARFTNQHRLARKAIHHLLADTSYVVNGVTDGHRL